MTSWLPDQPIPRPDIVMYAEFENYRENVPEGWTIEDVEFLWWAAAACLDYQALREELEEAIREGYDPGCFRYSPIADLDGNGRYPFTIFKLLREILPVGALLAVDDESQKGCEEICEVLGSFIIQNQIWHFLTSKVLILVPVEVLPDRLRDLRFSADLGL
ncbi:hypothetical protein M2262_003222 [Pseudomonas sp. BIGb0408]|uniref:Uncharacterized protein n=1 Tax=Phytopseudomonas flavescens TaxID=29435 RepID=A0A7Y9XLM8_9GAMM|nr:MULTISPECIES: hypothetical protein [Pseudomonas]MCW2293172.1 hypothetical protein [Pseudomonas sp. BIGb0408]NYH72257.1 hypothetical protein [Pseudomonas flavescens]